MDTAKKVEIAFRPADPIEGMNARLGKKVPLSGMVQMKPRMLQQDETGRYRAVEEAPMAPTLEAEPSSVVMGSDDLTLRVAELEKDNRALLRVIARQEEEIRTLRKGK